MGKETTKKSYHHGNLREALVRAGVELLQEQGYAALSLRSVAARAGVSHTAPYNHFADRRALLSAIAAEGFRGLLAALSFAPLPDARATLVKAGRAYLAFAAEQPESYRLMFTSDILVGNPDPDIGAVSVAAYGKIAAQVAALCGEELAGAVTAVVWSQLHGFALLLQEERIRPWMHGAATLPALGDALLATLPGAVEAAAQALRGQSPPPIGESGRRR